MTLESPSPEQPIEPPELELSFEVLSSDPELYRNQLVLLLRTLPWSYPVKNIQGTQAEKLVEFCLDPDNLDPVDPYLDTVLSNPLDDQQVGEILDGMTNARPERIGSKAMEALEDEKRLRLRLLAWSDLLGNMIASQSGNDNGDHPIEQSSPAA